MRFKNRRYERTVVARKPTSISMGGGAMEGAVGRSPGPIYMPTPKGYGTGPSGKGSEFSLAKRSFSVPLDWDNGWWEEMLSDFLKHNYHVNRPPQDREHPFLALRAFVTRASGGRHQTVLLAEWLEIKGVVDLDSRGKVDIVPEYCAKQLRSKQKWSLVLRLHQLLLAL